MSTTKRGSDGDTGLTSSGVQEAVSRHCEIDAPLASVRGRRTRELTNIVEYLIAHGELDRADLPEFFNPDSVSAPSQGRYGDYEQRAWVGDMVVPNLRRLPFVDENDGSWSFSGVNESDYGDGETRDLADIRRDADTQLESTLDSLGVGRRSEQREQLRELHSQIRERGEVTGDELETVVRGASLSELESFLVELPSVERRQNDPPEPAELEIETYTDVLDAEAAVEELPSVVWRYSE